MDTIINKRTHMGSYIGVIIPIFVMIFVQTHYIPFIVIAIIMSLFNINKPYVIYPAMFITSTNTNYFMIVQGLSCGLIFTTLMIVSLLINRSYIYKRKSNITLFWIIILIFFNLFQSIFSVTGGMNTFFLMAENLVLLYLLSIHKEVHLQDMIKCLTITSIICVLILLWAYLTGRMVENFEGRYTTEGVNENSMAITYAHLSLVLIFSYFYYRDKMIKTIGLASFLIALFLLLISGSRAALFAAIAGLFTVVVCFNIFVGDIRKKLFLFILLGGALYFGVNRMLELDLPVFERFKMENIIEGRGTNRMDRRTYLLTNVFPEHPFWGIGLGGENEYAISPGPCHNIIVDPLIQIGLVGILLYWIFIVWFIGKTPKLIKEYSMLILPLSLFITCLVHGMGEVIFFEKYFWNAIAMIALFANNIQSYSTSKLI